MALAFALTSLMTVLVLVGVVSVVWGTVFSDYTRSNIVEIANSAAEKLATSYEENGSWTAGELRTVATSSLVSDDRACRSSTKGVVVYDDSWPSASATADVRESESPSSSSSGKKQRIARSRQRPPTPIALPTSKSLRPLANMSDR